MTGNQPRILFTIFCDVIRQETGSKLAFMGVYPKSMIVDAFPATLASFAVAIGVELPQPSEHVTLELKVPGAEIISSELLELKQPGPGSSCTATLLIAPIVFPEAGEMVLTAKFSGGGQHEARLGVLLRRDVPQWPAAK